MAPPLGGRGSKASLHTPAQPPGARRKALYLSDLELPQLYSGSTCKDLGIMKGSCHLPGLQPLITKSGLCVHEPLLLDSVNALQNIVKQNSIYSEAGRLP